MPEYTNIKIDPKIESKESPGTCNNMAKSLLIILVCLISGFTHADEIEFPEEELARETTLPVFEKRRVVLNRNIQEEGRFEIGAGGGLELNEPYYNTLQGELLATYNITETSAVNLLGLAWQDGLSTYGQQLKAGQPNARPVPVPAFDPMKAPHPLWAVFGNYQFIAYYGKISVTKQGVMNLNLFGSAGIGYINMGTVNTVGANLGLGQNFFFTKHFGLRADLRWLIFQGPNATTQRLGPTDNPSASSFDNRLYFNAQLNLAAVIIL